MIILAYSANENIKRSRYSLSTKQFSATILRALEMNYERIIWSFSPGNFRFW